MAIDRTEAIKLLKMNTLENDYPYFTDEELLFYLRSCGSVQSASYECLLIKADSSSVEIPGLGIMEVKEFFRNQAQRFRGNYTRHAPLRRGC